MTEINKQFETLIENQKRITDLKLAKAQLNEYKLWLFMGE